MKSAKGPPEILPFQNGKAFRDWLEENANISDGIWLKIYKKKSGIASVTYPEALDEALCFGWIDGQLKSIDEKCYMQRFTPRRKKSMWSKRNIENIDRLNREGKMTERGWKEVEAARADGRWERAYDSRSNMTVPDDFLKRLSGNKSAAEFYETLDKTNKFVIGYRLQTAKDKVTREKRIKEILKMLAGKEKFY